MKQRILSLLVLLAAAVSGAWAKVPTFDQTIFESDAQLGQIYVTENTEITIADGAILTINGGLVIQEGATLTVNGPGTLVVNGTKGSVGTMMTGDPGGQGGAAISGDIIIKGATVNANGGDGGEGGSGGISYSGPGDQGGQGGNGGAAFTGAVTIYSGTISPKGGNGGDGGSGGVGIDPDNPGSFTQADKGPGGDGGNAFAGTLTFYGGTVNALGSMIGYGKPNGNASNAFVNPVTMNAATYVLKGGYYSASDEIELANIVNYRFVSIVAADYVEPTFDYELTVEASDHGSGTISYTVQDKDDAEKITENAKGANEGDKVTVKVTPDEGWRVDDTKNSHGDVTALLYRYWEGLRRAQAMVPMQRTVDLTYEDEDENGVFTYSFTMPASNVKVKAEYLKVSTLYFDPAEKTNLMEVKVDGIVRNVEDSKTVKIEKVEKVTEGAPVKLTANTGYKFRKVEVKKGSAAKTITIGDMELTYADGDNWQTIVGKNSDKIKILSNRIVQVAQPAPNTYKYIDVLTTAVKPSDFIDPSKNYQWVTMEVAW